MENYNKIGVSFFLDLLQAEVAVQESLLCLDISYENP